MYLAFPYVKVYLTVLAPRGLEKSDNPRGEKHPVVDSQLLDGKRVLPAFPRQIFGTIVGAFIDLLGSIGLARR